MGYTETLAAFMKANETDEALKMAQDALDKLPATASDAQREPLQKAVDDGVEALEELSAENQNPLMTPAINEAVRRAKVEQAHYQEQFNTMVAAEEIQASFQDMLAEDSPVRKLVLETLKPDSGMGQGDDGQALVDAIAGAYEAVDEAVNDAVGDLIGETGASAGVGFQF